MKIDGRNLNLASSHKNVTNGNNQKKINNPTLMERMTNKKSFAEKKREIDEAAKANGPKSIFEGAKEYRESLMTNRQNTTATKNKMRKLKYQFKSLSSKIISSKTSNRAKQVAGQARREIIRLNNERNKGNVDSEELEAAISHAKSMERIAKKKAKHLEEEELAKAASGIHTEYQPDDEFDKEKELKESQDMAMALSKLHELNTEDVEDIEEYEANEDADFARDMAFIESMSSLADMDFISDMTEMMDMSLIEDLNLEDFGLDELTEEVSAAKGNLEPSDLKMLKIKHRNKEMKDIAKADAEYLKAIFHHLQETKASGNVPAMGGGAPSPSVSGGIINIAVGASSNVAVSNSGSEASVDVEI